jgi:predicted secreted protein
MNPSLRDESLERFYHRGYNSFDNTLIFRNELLDLNEILSALAVLQNNCKGLILDFPKFNP